jgi:hypothetical protein
MTQLLPPGMQVESIAVAVKRCQPKPAVDALPNGLWEAQERR